MYFFLNLFVQCDVGTMHISPPDFALLSGDKCLYVVKHMTSMNLTTVQRRSIFKNGCRN
jgi:hypothetical protein